MTYGPFNRHPRDLRGRYQDRCRLAQWQVEMDEMAWLMLQVTKSLAEARHALDRFAAAWEQA